MTIGLDAPLPPARTGVADYAAALLDALGHYAPIETAPGSAGLWLYHLGNNQIHRETYLRALRHPGILVLHDAVLQHFFLGWLDERAYIDEFVYNYGEWNRDLARRLWRGRAASGLARVYYQFPMLKRIAETSRAVIVHNREAACMVRAHAPTAPVIEIPHLFQKPALPSGAERLRFRQALGVPACAFLFGVFGYLRESKRLMAVLRAFERLRQNRPNAFLLVAGGFVSSDLARAAAPLLGRPGTIRLPHLAEPDFWRAAAAVDACLNLREPSAGETSGITIRLMGIGKPVFVTEGPASAAYPPETCLRVAPGPAEADSLFHLLNLVTSIPEAACEIGRRGAGHIAVNHPVDRVAGQYWKMLCAYR